MGFRNVTIRMEDKTKRLIDKVTQERRIMQSDLLEEMANLWLDVSSEKNDKRTKEVILENNKHKVELLEAMQALGTTIETESERYNLKMEYAKCEANIKKALTDNALMYQNFVIMRGYMELDELNRKLGINPVE